MRAMASAGRRDVRDRVRPVLRAAAPEHPRAASGARRWMIVDGYGKVLSRPGLDLRRASCASSPRARSRGRSGSCTRTCTARCTRARRRPRFAKRSTPICGPAWARRYASLPRSCFARVLGDDAARGRSTCSLIASSSGSKPERAARVRPRSGARSSCPWAAPTAATAGAAAT